MGLDELLLYFNIFLGPLGDHQPPVLQLRKDASYCDSHAAACLFSFFLPQSSEEPVY